MDKKSLRITEPRHMELISLDENTDGCRPTCQSLTYTRP